MAVDLIAEVGRDSGWTTVRQPTLTDLGLLFEALGTADVFELHLQRSAYAPDRNERVYEPQLTILGENGLFHAHVRVDEELFCYEGGDGQAVGDHRFTKAEQGCGEQGLTFPMSQVGSDKAAFRRIAERYWAAGDWHGDDLWSRLE